MAKIKYTCFVLLVIVLSFITVAQGNEFCSVDENFEENLYNQIVKSTIMCTQHIDDKIIYHKFCRDDKLCLQSLRLYTQYIIKHATEYNLDPYLIAALILHESNFDAYRKSKRDARSIVQLNPRSKWGQSSKFVSNKQYRKLCRDVPGHCQEEVVRIATELIRSHLDDSGSIERTLTWYNTGKDFYTRKAYVNPVMSNYKKLSRNEQIVPRCD